MAAGEVVSVEDRAVIAEAVAAAERSTGLQLCVYLGPADGDPRRHAEALLAEASARSRPSVMLYVAPESRRVECVVAAGARDRVPDAAAQRAVDRMLPLLAAGRLAEGLREGLQELAEAAGPGLPEPGAEELPDVLG